MLPPNQDEIDFTRRELGGLSRMFGEELAWFDERTFKLMSGEMVRPKAQVTGIDSEVVTSGKKMQVHQ